ncbi:hypothetical protein [Fodinibius sp. Rm-B-1B1-1]|uniref:hypothetical protein n=1 Tax=Fodinibius alkaliphilus TaxID=3140241 RepID=UPI00315A79D2
MKVLESYEEALMNISPKEWPAYLKEHAFISGNKFNTELAETFALVGTVLDFKKFIGIDHLEGPTGTSESFLTYCGVLGYGRYLSKYYDHGLFMQLRQRANDPRLEISQGVVKALQYIAKKKFDKLLLYTDDWKNGTPLEQCACIGAVCNAKVLSSRTQAESAIELLDWVTATFFDKPIVSGDYLILQEQLIESWKVAASRNPEKAQRMIERWIKEEDATINSIMEKIITSNYMQKIDSEWADRWLDNLNNKYRA